MAPKVAKELAPLAVKRLTDPGRHAVGGVRGLYLNVTESGARQWVLRIKVGGRRRRGRDWSENECALREKENDLEHATGFMQ